MKQKKVVKLQEEKGLLSQKKCKGGGRLKAADALNLQ
jgi:hypothetical protein